MTDVVPHFNCVVVIGKIQSVLDMTIAECLRVSLDRDNPLLHHRTSFFGFER